ncbi:unnamed protein product [Sphagnum troendelagicum]|uniref:Uncharacterized protein n=1 Tax=Sphagnum troendelagicum TaxID=128251 RepID=A0ABP0UWY7_9BRYO
MATMSMMFVSGLVPAKISASSTSASSVLSSSSCTSSSSVGCIRTWVHVRSSCSSSSSHQLHHGSLLVPTKRRLFRDSSSSSSFISSSNVRSTTRLGSLVGDKLVIRKRRRIIAPAPPHSRPRPAGRIIAEQKTDLLRVLGFALRAGKEGLDAGTKLVPETVPRPVAQVGVGLVGVFMVTYFLRYLFTTALFILVIGVFSYMAYLFLNKDNDSTGGGGGGGDSGTSDDPVEEARRIMEKYK